MGRVADPPSFADKLDRLFRIRLQDNGREHTHGQLARFISQCTGDRHSTTFISQLRGGRASNPRRSVINAIAEFFQVDPTYFFSAPHQGDEDDVRAASALLRLSELAPDQRAAVLALIDSMARRPTRD